MKTYQEVFITSRNLNDDQILDAIKSFSNESKGWNFLEEETLEYSHHVGEHSCIIEIRDGKNSVTLAIAKLKKGKFYVTNIVPKYKGKISMTQYNGFVKRFANGLKSFIKRKKISIAVSISNEDIGLEQIITSPKAREFFSKYLGAYPRSYHPTDIRRLDEFICVASIYCKKKIEHDKLERYLVEDLKWDVKIAKWCRNRIETGLEIITVYKKF